jgi:hypothetical protein
VSVCVCVCVCVCVRARALTSLWCRADRQGSETDVFTHLQIRFQQELDLFDVDISELIHSIDSPDHAAGDRPRGILCV